MPRFRVCKVCGDVHDVANWPDNHREPQYDNRNPELATPLVTPPFEAFRTGVLPGSSIINSRDDKREYMKRNDLCEWDPGTGDTSGSEWVREKEETRDRVADLKRFQETDPLALPPELKAQPMDDKKALEGSSEISTEDVEVFE